MKLYFLDAVRGVTTGARVAQFPGRHFTMGTLNHCGGAELLRDPPKSPNSVAITFFNTVNLLSKELRFDHGAPNLFFFAPGAI